MNVWPHPFIDKNTTRVNLLSTELKTEVKRFFSSLSSTSKNVMKVLPSQHSRTMCEMTDVILVSVLLNLNKFHTLTWCCYY